MHTRSGDHFDSRDKERQLIDRLIDIAASGRVPTTIEEAGACRLAAMLLIYRKSAASAIFREAFEKSAIAHQVTDIEVKDLLSLPGVLGIFRFSDNINKALNGIRI